MYYLSVPFASNLSLVQFKHVTPTPTYANHLECEKKGLQRDD